MGYISVQYNSNNNNNALTVVELHSGKLVYLALYTQFMFNITLI